MAKSNNVSEILNQAIDNAKENIVWLPTQKSLSGRVYSDKDVSIVKTNKTEKSKSVYSFTFRNDCAKKIGKLVLAGTLANRLYITTVENGGYAITIKENANKSQEVKKPMNGYMKVPAVKETEWLDNFIGNYDLKFDEILGMHYVEITAESILK